MAGTPPQIPRFSFPGLEYLNTAPGRNIAIDRRQAYLAIQSAFTNVPLSALGQTSVTLQLDSQFTRDKGIYIKDMRIIFDPGDNSGALLITGILQELQIGGSGVYDLGFPLLTLTQPNLPTVASAQSDLLITANDIVQLGQTPPATGCTGTSALIGGTLSVTSQINVNNRDAGAAHSFRLRVGCIYTILSGLLQ